MKKLLIVCALLAIAPGCGDDDTPEQSEPSSGGESPTQSDSPAGMEAPPGSTPPVEPDEDPAAPTDEAPSEEAPAEAGGESPAEPEAPTAEADVPDAPPEDEPNPWGATRAEQCAMPERAPLSAGAQQALVAGRQAAANGDLSGAQGHFQRALREDAAAYQAAFNLGVLADRGGNPNRAMEYYRQALAIRGDDHNSLEGMVRIHLRRGSVPDAVAAVDPVARQNTRNLNLQALHVQVLTQAERYDDAWRVGRGALSCDERHAATLKALVKLSTAQGRTELAGTILEQALEVSPNDAELHYIQGRRYLEEPGRLGAAIAAFERAVAADPEFLEARVALGRQQLVGGNYRGALENLQAALDLAPRSVPIRLSVADTYRALRQWEDAKDTFDQVLQTNPDIPEAHFNLGLMYQTAGADFPGLDDMQAYQRAIEEFRTYRNLMGSRLGREDPSEHYLERLDRLVERIQRNREAEEEERREEAERAAREAAAAEAAANGEAPPEEEEEEEVLFFD